MAIDLALKKPFTEAVDMFRGKVNMPTARWDDLWKDQHARGFMIAGATKAELLADIRAAVDKAISEGATLAEFRKDFDRIVAKHGWSYNGGRNWRSSVIYRTNIRTAYSAGRWEQMTDPDLLKLKPYLLYRHGDSAQPRPMHLSWDGTVLPADHPWWDTHYTPNGWGCQCKVFSVGQRDLDRMGLDGPTAAPPIEIDPKTGAPFGIDKGWDYNVGKAAEKGWAPLMQKFETLAPDLGRTLMTETLQGPAFERFYNAKLPGNFPVSVLRQEDKAALGSQAQTVLLSQETLSRHLVKHPEIGLDDYRKIPTIIDQGEVWQRADKPERLVYLAADEKVYRAALKRTEDGLENYFLTLFETSEELADEQVRDFMNPGKEYKRIR